MPQATYPTKITTEVSKAIGNCTQAYLLENCGNNPRATYSQIVIGITDALCDWLRSQEMILIIGAEKVANGGKCPAPITFALRKHILEQAVRIEDLDKETN